MLVRGTHLDIGRFHSHRSFDSSSGVGTAAIQLAKFFGAHVATTVGSDEKVSFCRNLGADTIVNYKQGSWSESV